MQKVSAVIAGLLVASHSVLADDSAKVVGVWKLLSFETEYQDGRPRGQWNGKNPTGYIIFTAAGRMMTVIEGEGRKPAKTDEDRVALLQTMIAYTGEYRLEDNKWITKVDVSWFPSWNGQEQVRYYKLDGDQLQVKSAWLPAPNLPGSPIIRGILLWERVK